MGSHVEQAARVTGPKAVADATARTGVQRIAVSGTNTQVALPTASLEPGCKSSIGDRFIRILAYSADVQWAEGEGAAPTLVWNQVAAPGTGHVAAGATLIAGFPEHEKLGSKTTHLAFITGGGAGFVEFYVSDRPVV